VIAFISFVFSFLVIRTYIWYLCALYLMNGLPILEPILVFKMDLCGITTVDLDVVAIFFGVAFVLLSFAGDTFRSLRVTVYSLLSLALVLFA
jgi:hypothetical protein